MRRGLLLFGALVFSCERPPQNRLVPYDFAPGPDMVQSAALHRGPACCACQRPADADFPLRCMRPCAACARATGLDLGVLLEYYEAAPELDGGDGCNCGPIE